MNIPTIKVKPWGADQGDHVIINEADFDPAVHKRFEAGASDAPAAARLDPVEHDGGPAKTAKSAARKGAGKRKAKG